MGKTYVGFWVFFFFFLQLVTVKRFKKIVLSFEHNIYNYSIIFYSRELC